MVIRLQCIQIGVYQTINDDDNLKVYLCFVNEMEYVNVARIRGKYTVW